MKRSDRIRETIDRNWMVPSMPDGHTERFAMRLEKSKSTNRTTVLALWSTLLSVAAAIAIVIFMQQGSTMSAAEKKMASIKGYYASLLWEESEYIEQITADLSPVTREQLINDVKIIKEQADSVAETILRNVEDEELKIHYMVVSYTSHLGSLKKLRAYFEDKLNNFNAY